MIQKLQLAGKFDYRIEDKINEIIDTVNSITNTESVIEWPQEGDKYFFLSTGLEVKDKFNSNQSDDKARIKVGNCFKTSEEALEWRKKIISLK